MGQVRTIELLGELLEGGRWLEVVDELMDGRSGR